MSMTAFILQVFKKKFVESNWHERRQYCLRRINFDILPTPKGGWLCYQQPMLKNLSLTRSPARVDAPTQFIRYYRMYSKIKVQIWQDEFCAVSSPQLKQGDFTALFGKFFLYRWLNYGNKFYKNRCACWEKVPQIFSPDGFGVNGGAYFYRLVRFDNDGVG